MAVYYVDKTGGDDGNTGLAIDAAWETIGKVNAVSFAAGDSVLFKCGETWTDAILTPATSGTAVSPIRFGAYGEAGVPPKFDLTGQDYCVHVQAQSYLCFRHLWLYGADCAFYVAGNGAKRIIAEFVLADAATNDCFKQDDLTEVILRSCEGRGATDDCLSLHNGSMVAEDCVFAGGAHGVNNVGGSQLVLKRCTIANCSTGLQFGALQNNQGIGERLRVYSSIIRDCTIGFECGRVAGANVFAHLGAWLHACEFSGCTTGITASYCTDVILRHCVISGGTTGIELNGNASVQIARSQILDPTNGVVVQAAADGRLTMLHSVIRGGTAAVVNNGSPTIINEGNSFSPSWP